jgi:hypothetical protein
MTISRRRFLERGAAAFAAGLLGCEEETSAPGPWGAPTTTEAPLVLSPGARPDALFELFMFGGLCAWDTFYAIPEMGMPLPGEPHSGRLWWTYQAGANSVPEVFARCGGGDAPLLQEYGRDSAGRTVHLGPWLLPLRQRPDLLRRMRVWVMRHDQVPHQGGNPLSLCGHRLGSPRLAGTAAHVQRFFHGQTPRGRSLPFSTVLLPRNRDAEANHSDAAATVGLHSRAARPLVVWLNDKADLAEELQARAAAQDLPRLALAEHYTETFERRLRYSERNWLQRSPALEEYRGARRALEDAADLSRVLRPDSLDLLSGSSCGETSDVDMTSTGMDLGLRFLRDPSLPAKYVVSVDGGFLPTTGGASYDTHSLHVVESARNVTHAIRGLVDRINEPGEGDPNKFDLDRETVLITTEFGRTPYREGDSGLDHWPGGYVQVALGGFVDEERSGIVGAIGEDGFATDYITPAEFRAAMLLAQGIWPFTPESFAVGDVREGRDERESAAWLLEHVLGYRA